MTRIVALIDLPSGLITCAESLGAPISLDVTLVKGTHRVLIDDTNGNVRVELVGADPLAVGPEIDTLVIEGYSLLVGDADAIARAADRDGERFWSELFSRIAASEDGIAAGALELVSGAKVAFTGMRDGTHAVRELLDPEGRRQGILVEG